MRLAVLLAISLATLSFSAAAGPVFSAATVTASQTFEDALSDTTMTIAWDGSSYWSASGGSTGGQRLARYSADGAVIDTYAPGHDFRSVFTDGSTLLARDFNTPVIYQQSTPGVFDPLLTLTGGGLDAQSSVVKDGNNYIAMADGVVSLWDASGNRLPIVELKGYGSQNGEDSYPENRGIAVSGDYWLTYSSGVLSAWDHSGNRADEITLAGAGTSFNSYFSLSVANNKVFVVDDSGQTWRGYEVIPVPEPENYAMWLIGMALLGVVGCRRKV